MLTAADVSSLTGKTFVITSKKNLFINPRHSFCRQVYKSKKERKLASSNFFSKSAVIPEEESMEVDSSTELAVGNAIGWNIPKIEESNSGTEATVTGMKRFINILDQLDTSVERLRREARDLQDKRDSLLMSMDLIRNNENFSDLNEYEREELNCYLGRITTRLSTVDLNVTTIRDKAQEESLHQVNSLIDSVITTSDRIAARLHCQHYLNCCSDGGGVERVTDKKFEMALLGCALDDQKNIKKRLQALMTYLNKQIIAVE